MIYSDKSTFKPHWVIGYTDRNHLMLDIDNCSYTKVLWLVKMLQVTYPKVGDCLIMESSHTKHRIEVRYTIRHKPYQKSWHNSYHLIFDNRIGYNCCVRIIELLAGLGILERSFLYMRHFRGDITMRVSPTVMSYGVKSIPKPIEYVYSDFTNRRDGYTRRYFRFYTIAYRLFLLGSYPKAETNDSSNSTNNSSEYNTIKTHQ